MKISPALHWNGGRIILRSFMKLPFMPETWSLFLPVLAVGLAGLAAGNYWGNWFLDFLGVVVLVMAALILNFFRDFERVARKGFEGESGPVAGGRQSGHREERGGKVFSQKNSVHIAIFMNPLNNHVQRAPFDGKVVKKVYHPGEFLAAYDDKADLVNEQAHLLVELKSKDKKARSRAAWSSNRSRACCAAGLKPTPKREMPSSGASGLAVFCWAPGWMCSCRRILSPLSKSGTRFTRV
jgi:hypothetical protein